MSLFASILSLLKSRDTNGEEITEQEREALRQAWGLDPSDPVLDSAEMHREPTDPTGTSYDQQIWRKKIVRIVSDPAEISRERFFEHVSEIWKESHALGFSPEVIFETAQEAFRSAVRHVVADREITTAEHIYLEEIKEVFGLPNDMAEKITREIVTEAETIFESKIRGV